MKNHISTFGNSTLKYFIFAFFVGFGLLFFGCKSKEEVQPNQPPQLFNVTAKLLANEQDLILTWTKSIDPDGDIVTYSVVYTDTLAKNLSDTTFIIKNLPFETEVKGNVIAKDTKGSKTISNFSIKTGKGYILIPDINFEKALIQLKIDDVQDGRVLRTSILKVTSLSVSSSPTNQNNTYDKIKDLTGIEEFINLKSLKCSHNSLTNLDVSKNTNLTVIECYSNQLTSLDVSKNVNLAAIECSSNKLTNLDISKNVALNELGCYSNQLTSLDVSKNVNLTILICISNQLTSLDISKNMNLTILWVASNQLTNLDVSKNTKLTGVICSSNQLTNLDVSKNTKLTKLICDSNQLVSLEVDKSVNLTDLACTSNQLTSLDVNKNTNLTYLRCQNNKIQTICINNLNQANFDWIKDPTATYKVCP